MGLIFRPSPSFIHSTWLVRRDGPTDGDAADSHASQPLSSADGGARSRII